MTLRTHRVKPGEQLVDISRRYYNSERYALVIWQHNRGKIQNPNQVYPGQVLVIPHIKVRNHG